MTAMTTWLCDPNPSSRWQSKLGQTYFGWLRLRRNPLAMAGLAIVAALLQLRRALENQNTGEVRGAEVEAAQTQVVNLINTFYREKLVAMPTSKDYIDQVQALGPAH